MKPQGHPDYDPMLKISPLLDRLREKMKLIEPKERHPLDE